MIENERKVLPIEAIYKVGGYSILSAERDSQTLECHIRRLSKPFSNHGLCPGQTHPDQL